MAERSPLIDRLEGAPLIRFHYVLLAASCLTYLFAAMNTVLIAPVLDLIAKEFSLGTLKLGWLISSLYLGMLLGALSWGRLADMIGRKRAIILTTAIHSVFTGSSALVKDFAAFLILRFLAGYGLGGVLPLPGVYISEYVPAPYRGRFVGTVETSWVWGALLAAGLGLLIAPGYGWRRLFLTAYVPIALIPFLALFVPESIRYLEERGRREEAEEILRRVGLLKGAVEAKEGTAQVRRASFKELFSPAYLKRTILLWILWFVLVYTYHGVFIWLKGFFVKTGVVKEPLLFYFIATLAQIPGYYSATFLLDRVGRLPVLLIYLTMAGVACFFFNFAHDWLSVLLVSCVIGFFNLGAWAGLYTYTPELYPTRIRGLGSGTSASFGRLGGFLQGPLTGHILQLGLPFTFLKFSLLHLAGALALITLGVETKGRVLEEISK